MESEDWFVAHGTHAADFQPLKQAPDGGVGGNGNNQLAGFDKHGLKPPNRFMLKLQYVCVLLLQLTRFDWLMFFKC